MKRVYDLRPDNSRRIPPEEMSFQTQVTLWMKFYRCVFHTELDIPVPRAVPYGFEQLLIVAQGLTIRRVLQASEKYFDYYFLEDDQADTGLSHARLSARQYQIWVAPTDDTCDDSPLPLAYVPDVSTVTDSITMLERLLFALFRYWETGRYLDYASCTICSGSVRPDGSRIMFSANEIDGGHVLLRFVGPHVQNQAPRYVIA